MIEPTRVFLLRHGQTAWNVEQQEVLPVATCTTTTAAARVSPETDADQRVRPLLARVRVLKTAGKPVLSAADWLNGHRPPETIC